MSFEAHFAIKLRKQIVEEQIARRLIPEEQYTTHQRRDEMPHQSPPFLALITPLAGEPPGGGEGPPQIWGPPGPWPTPPIYLPIPPDAIAPGVPTHPIYLPVYPAHPIVIPPGSIDPGPPPRPEHPIVLPPPYPAHPIVIPPDSVAPGVPTHPIYLPPQIWGPPGPWPTPPIAGIPGLPGYTPPVQPPGMPTNPISGVTTVYMYVPGAGFSGPYHLTPGETITVPGAPPAPAPEARRKN